MGNGFTNFVDINADEMFVGVGDVDREGEDNGEMLTAVVRIIKHPAFRWVGMG